MILLDKSRCPHNHPCPLTEACPVRAITQNEEGYPEVDAGACILCGKCVERCPMKAMRFSDDAGTVLRTA